MRLSIVLLLCQMGFGLSEYFSYNGYHQYRVSLATQAEAELLNNMSGTIDGVHCPNTWATQHDNFVIVAPNQLDTVIPLLQNAGVTFDLVTRNIQTLIDLQNPKLQESSSGFDWNSYRTLEEYNSWYNILAQQYPDQVKQLVIGQSVEGRDIIVIKVSYKPGNPSVIIEGGIHAREWISPATTSFILNELLTSNVSSVRHIAENNDWYILPIYNPDGYVYSQNNARLWRGNRNVFECKYGVDLNRNFDIHWKRGKCNRNEGGAAPNSEPETRAYIRFLATLDANSTTAILLHSAGQRVAVPRGLTKDQNPDYPVYKRIAQKVIASLAQRYGTKYDFDDNMRRRCSIQGDSLDHMYERFKMKAAFLYELRPNQSSPFHFLLPSNEIISTALETLDSIVTLLDEVNNM